MNLTLSRLHAYNDVGLLVLRVIVGITYVWFGWDKLLQGPDGWRGVGSAVSAFGIPAGHLYFGIAATFFELLGGLCLIFGLLTRLAAFFLCGTMVVAAWKMAQPLAGDLTLGTMIGFFYPFSMVGVTFSLIFLGAGKHSFDGRAERMSSSADT